MAKVLIFKLRPVENPFGVRKEYDIVKDLKHIEWSADLNTYQLSETLNNQIILNRVNFAVLGGMCDKILKGETLNPEEIFIVEIGKEGQFLEKHLGIKDLNLAKSVCKNYDSSDFDRAQWDVLSRDQDALNNIEKFNNIHAVVLLDLNNEYTGHIYTWLSPDNKHLLAIGIRSRVDMLFLRAENKGMSNVSDYLLEGLRVFALKLGVIDIIIPRPLPVMQKLLTDKFNFKKKIISVNILESPIRIHDVYAKEMIVYVNEDLNNPMTKNIMSLTIIN